MHSNDIQGATRHKRYCEQLWIRGSLYIHYEMFKVLKSNLKIALPLPSHDITIEDLNMQGKPKDWFQGL